MTLQDFFVAGPYDDGDAVTGHYYEMASADPTRPQVWGYTDKISYSAGPPPPPRGLRFCATGYSRKSWWIPRLR